MQPFNTLLHTLRLSARALGRRPAFSLAAVLVLALGLGVCSTLYAFLEALLLRPMPGVTASEELVRITAGSRGRSGQGLSHPEFRELEAGTREVFRELAAYSATPFALGSDGGRVAPERIAGQLVSANYFDTLGVSPALGRFFVEDDDATAAAPVVVLSDRLWRSRFGGDAATVGRRLVVNGADVEVVGVAPPRFRGPELGAAADLWLPLAHTALARPGEPGLLSERGAAWLGVLGRRAPGVSEDQARVALRTAQAALSKTFPSEEEHKTFTLTPARSGLSPAGQRDLGPIALLGTVLAALLLLLVCSNVANLLLARALGRGREVRIRIALGAGRSRLAGELLAESLLLALAAAGVGLLLAVWVSDLLLALLPANEFAELAAQPNPRWLAVAFLLALVSTLAAGLGPALLSTRRQQAALGSLATRAAWPRRLVVAQLALSLVLLTTAAVSLGMLARAGSVDLGFEPDGVLALSFDLELQGQTPTERENFRAELLERAGSHAQTLTASLANLPPLSGIVVGNWASPAEAADPDQEGGMVHTNGISPAYFETLGIPVLAGRLFSPDDRAGAPSVVMVNHTAALRFLGEEAPIGRRLLLGGRGGETVEVVGVVADSRVDEATEDPVPVLYRPLSQASALGRTTLLVRWQGEITEGLARLREDLLSLNADLPVFEATTLPTIARNRVDKQRGLSWLLSAFGVLGLGLAAVGLFGLVSQWVALRRRELGVRIALGARPSDVKRLVVGDSLRLAARGALVGALVSAAALPLLAKALGSFAASDLLAFLGALALLTVTALVTTWLPTRKAVATDPVVVLREE